MALAVASSLSISPALPSTPLATPSRLPSPSIRLPPLPSTRASRPSSRIVMSAAPVKEHNVAGLTAAAVAAAMIIPEIAEAAQPGVSPSLKNLLLSVVAGGFVLLAIAGAVAGVSSFDPVKRS